MYIDQAQASIIQHVKHFNNKFFIVHTFHLLNTRSKVAISLL
uniref:Uncharacterized protein n=1 Tax=Siphoviridae sp. ctnN38 TaxID=2826455 RepID=A0A8S5N625_9CAUD|nr:MAG TPA: hypothetical protein [Siphoviridae sp. ctnN38]DAU15007.1 MAG TPA: hypothetical protein [Caudoviricetes sp.]